jgi:gluconokinase
MSLVGTSASGAPLTPCFSYAESAPDTARVHTPALRARVACGYPGGLAAAYNRTGTPIHSAYAGPTLLRLATTTPSPSATQAAQFSDIRCWQSFASYLLSRWCDRPGLPVSYSEASWTGLFDRHALDWDADLLSVVGVDATTLAPVVDYDGLPRELRLSPAMLQRWPAMASARLFLGIGDGAAANVGSKCTGSGRVAVTIGTSAALRAVVPRRAVGASVPPGLWCYTLDAEHSLVGGALTDGGSVYQWLEGVLVDDHGKHGGDVNNNNSNGGGDGGGGGGSAGLVVLPFLGGERSPGWNDGARCTIHGLSRGTTASDIRRACLESIALRLGAIFFLVQPLVKGGVREIVASGTALKTNASWKQMVADALGCSLVVEPAAELTSRGIAVMMRRAMLRGGGSKADALPVEVLSDDREVFAPDMHAHARFARTLEAQERLYDKVCGKSWLRVGGESVGGGGGGVRGVAVVAAAAAAAAAVFAVGFLVGRGRTRRG